MVYSLPASARYWPSLAGNRIALELRRDLHRDRVLADVAHLIRRRGGEEMHGARDRSGPAGLVIGAQAHAVVAVEVFVELDVIAPVGIVLELLLHPVHRPGARFVLQEDAGET